MCQARLGSRMASEKTSEEPLRRVPPNPLPNRRWWQSQPMDERGSRTMFVGLLVAFAIYGLSFVVSAVYKGAAWVTWASLALILASVVFLGAWFFAVRAGFRLGKERSRATRRAEMHAKKEKEKRMRLNR